MMKRILLLAVLMVFAACSKNKDQFDSYGISFDGDEISATSSVDTDTFIKNAYGHCWRPVSTYEILEGGTLSSDKYIIPPGGGRPSEYYFEKGELKEYTCPPSDISSGLCCYNHGFTFKDSAVYKIGLAGVWDQFTLMVLDIDEDSMTCIEYLGFTAKRKLYGLTRFARMTEEEYKKLLESVEVFADVD